MSYMSQLPVHYYTQTNGHTNRQTFLATEIYKNRQPQSRHRQMGRKSGNGLKNACKILRYSTPHHNL